MRRIKTAGRRYGRNESPVAAGGTTHIIKIGYNGGSGREPVALKLNGFLVCKDTLGQDKKPVIDEEAMARLGCTRDRIDRALKQDFTTANELLPTSLRFVLMADAVRDGEAWLYGGIFAELYECFNKKGLFCYGDGESATRKCEDGSKRHVACNPYGKFGVEPAQYCGLSGPKKDCRSHGRLTVCLYYLDDQGRPAPLSPELGMQARARWDTSSEYADMEILAQLDRAAGRTRGMLNGLTGTLTFHRRGRRTGEKDFAKAIVGHVTFVIDEEAIRKRERLIREEDERRHARAIEASKAGLPAALLEAPVIPVDETIEEQVDPELNRDASETIAQLPAVPPEPSPDSSSTTQVDEEVLASASDPFDPPPRLSVADSSDEALADALRAYCATVVQRLADGTTAGAILQQVAEEADPRVRDHRVVLGSVDWFFAGTTPRQQAGRPALLRQICEHLQANEDPDFILKAERAQEVV